MTEAVPRLRRMFSRLFVACIVAFCTSHAQADSKRLNVLFLAVDDLRPQLGCYGDPLAKTPNLDKLAGQGLLFNRAYCQQAVCSPSRSSLLTGRRPDTTRVYDLETHFRKAIPDVVTLPQHFRQSGYHAQSLGKIFHPGFDDPASWSVPATPRAGDDYSPATMTAVKARRQKLRKQGVTGRDLRQRGKGPAWEAADVKDDALPDGITAAKAIAALGAIKDKPFFLAVGFAKPHLPFVAPKKYFDLYPLEAIDLAEHRTRPADAPHSAMTHFGELRTYQGMPKGDAPVSDDTARELIRAYYAATSYCDAMVGRVVAEVDRLGLRDSTAIVLWGDHGWHLGDAGLWCKHTNFEVAVRAPLILSVPGQTTAGKKTDALVELVDVYPTLCELARLELPTGLEGTSAAPLLTEPERPWKTAAFSQYPREDVMGYSMRTDRYRYTEWQDKQGKAVAIELYDHQCDPAETRNVASEKGQAETAAQLSRQLKAGWRAVLPE